MGMNASLWNQAGELPDRDDEPEEKWPAVGGSYDLTVAMAPDGKALVIDAPEEFWVATRDEEGSLHLREWMPRSVEAGVYRVRARFVFEEGRGEAGSHDPGGDCWYFEPVAMASLIRSGEPYLWGEWVDIPAS